MNPFEVTALVVSGLLSIFCLMTLFVSEDEFRRNIAVFIGVFALMFTIILWGSCADAWNFQHNIPVENNSR